MSVHMWNTPEKNVLWLALLAMVESRYVLQKTSFKTATTRGRKHFVDSSLI